MQARRRSGGASRHSRVHRLVAVVGHRRVADVRRKREAAGPLEGALELGAPKRGPHDPAALAELLDRLDGELSVERAEPRAGARAARGTDERLPETVGALLEQQHLARAARRTPHRDARAQDAAAVDDDEIAWIEQVRQLVEAPVLDRAVAPVHEQARCVASLGRPLRDQVLGQRVVELVGTHGGSLAGDARPPANGSA